MVIILTTQFNYLFIIHHTRQASKPPKTSCKHLYSPGAIFSTYVPAFFELVIMCNSSHHQSLANDSLKILKKHSLRIHTHMQFICTLLQKYIHKTLLGHTFLRLQIKIARTLKGGRERYVCGYSVTNAFDKLTLAYCKQTNQIFH